jgi:hypothetical protein
MIRKHGQVKPVAGKIQRAYIKNAQSEEGWSLRVFQLATYQ